MFAGWKVPKSRAHPEWTPLEALQWRPHPDGIVEQLHAAYASRGDESLRARAREGAMEYDADYVTERYWKPVLEEVEQRIGRPRLVAGPIPQEAA